MEFYLYGHNTEIVRPLKGEPRICFLADSFNLTNAFPIYRANLIPFSCGYKETELTTCSKGKYPQGMLPCESSIPGSHVGVCCSRHIPVGTWIGPYEGEVIRPEELTANRDNNHIWEVSYVMSAHEITFSTVITEINT